MKLSRTTRYAIRAVVQLARRDGERVAAETLSRELDLPENYLSKTLHALGQEGILDSSRGPGGGYRLAVPPAELPLARVIETFETLDATRECVLGRPECSESDPCPAHEEWTRVAERVAAFFRETTVADVVGDPPTTGPDPFPTDAPPARRDN